MSIVDRQTPYNEVLVHFRACTRRGAATTDEQVAGLATHIANLIVEREREEDRMRHAG